MRLARSSGQPTPQPRGRTNKDHSIPVANYRKIIIVDGMAEAQCLKKEGEVTKFRALKLEFIRQIKVISRRECGSAEMEAKAEMKLVFDPYNPEDEATNLKAATQAKRSSGVTGDHTNYDIHDDAALNIHTNNY